MATRRQIGLKRAFGARDLGGTIADRAAGSMFFVLGVVAASALGATPLVFVVGGVAFLMTMLSYLEGLTMLPHAGGSSNVARYAFNELISFGAGWALVLDYVLTVAIAAFFASHYLTTMPGFEPIDNDRAEIALAAVLIAVAGAISVRGGRIADAIGNVVSIVVMATMALIVLVGAVLLSDPAALTSHLDLGTTPTWDNLAFALPLAMVAFSGLELASNRAEELNDPAKRLARPFIYSSLAAIATTVGVAAIAILALPVRLVDGVYATKLGVSEAHSGFQETPLIGIVRQLFDSHSADVALTVWISVVAVLVLYLFTNASLGALSRLAFAMSRNRQLPSALVRIDRETGTPLVATVICCLLSIGALLLTATLKDSPIFMVQLYAFGAMLSFAIGNLSVFAVRLRAPDLARPFRAPLNFQIRGRDISLVTVGAALASVFIWGLMLVTHDVAREVGTAWMIVGMISYCFYRVTHGISITGRADLRESTQLEIDVEPYRSLLLCVPPSKDEKRERADEELVALASKLLDLPQHSELVALSVFELPLTQPLTQKIDVLERATTARLARVREYTDKLELPLSTTTVRSRAAGRSICQEAERRHVDAVVMIDTPKRRVGDVLIGKTVEYVLRHAPCEVVVLRLPELSRS
jgi:APA family basic amino acid/polyamine antiporter